jgi:hypothetical protein
MKSGHSLSVLSGVSSGKKADLVDRTLQGTGMASTFVAKKRESVSPDLNERM